MKHLSDLVAKNTLAIAQLEAKVQYLQDELDKFYKVLEWFDKHQPKTDNAPKWPKSLTFTEDEK